jgi:hypothetical protein
MGLSAQAVSRFLGSDSLHRAKAARESSGLGAVVITSSVSDVLCRVPTIARCRSEEQIEPTCEL